MYEISIAGSAFHDEIAVPAGLDTESAERPLTNPSGSRALSSQVALMESSGLLLLSSAIALNLSVPADAPIPGWHPSTGLVKRVFDIVTSLGALIFCMPILVICAVTILFESGGPIFFRQRRLGLSGKPFSILKFRTMVRDAESALERHLQSNPEARREWDADRKLRKDPRILWIGSILRKFSLDELPQLWNVLKGDMSLVGPRPIVNQEIERYRAAYREYCRVRPGITGLWQVSGRNDTGYAERVALDCAYVRKWSFLLDLGIILKTASVVVKAAGAY